MKFNSEVTDKITHWKEKLTALPTDVFLDYARMFLGEISTPFNKQNLVTQVAVFFCQEENKKNDTRECMCHFFEGEEMFIFSS